MSPQVFPYVIAHGGGYEGFLTDPGTMIWSGVLRALEAALHGAPFLLVGVVVAGLLRGMLGPQRLRSLLGGGPWLGPVQGSLFGVLLPVCSLGVLPVARELRRSRVPSGTIVSFLLVAPVLNPISVLYGLSQVSPQLVMYFVAGTFVVALGLSWFWNHWCDRTGIRTDEIDDSVPRDARARLAIAADATGEYLVGPIWIDYALIFVSVGLLGALLPQGAFQTSLAKNSLSAPLLMAVIAIPAYVTPFQEMMLFNVVVREGYSLAAAFVLAILGAGLSTGLLRWLWREYGRRPVLAAGGLLFIATLCAGTAIDRASAGQAVTGEDHTHAFDFLTRPSGTMSGLAGWRTCWATLSRNTAGYEWVSLLCLVGTLGTAGAVRALAGPLDVASLLAPAREIIPPPGAAWWNRPLSPRVAASASGLMVLGLCVSGAYVVYPAPAQLLDDMNSLHADVVFAARTSDWPTVQRQVGTWQPLAGRLQAGAWLRQGTVTNDQVQSADDLRFTLHSVKECLDNESYADAEVLAVHLDRVYRACRDIYRSSPSGAASAVVSNATSDH